MKWHRDDHSDNDIFIVPDILFYWLNRFKIDTFISECILAVLNASPAAGVSWLFFMIPQKSGNSFFVVVRKKFSFVYWNNIALGQAHGNQI